MSETALRVHQGDDDRGGVDDAFQELGQRAVNAGKQPAGFGRGRRDDHAACVPFTALGANSPAGSAGLHLPYFVGDDFTGLGQVPPQSVCQRTHAFSQRKKQRPCPISPAVLPHAAQQAAVLALVFDEARNHAVGRQVLGGRAVDSCQQRLRKVLDGLASEVVLHELGNGSLGQGLGAAKPLAGHANLGG